MLVTLAALKGKTNASLLPNSTSNHDKSIVSFCPVSMYDVYMISSDTFDVQ